MLIAIIPYAVAIKHRSANGHCIYRKWSDDCMLPGIETGKKEPLYEGDWRTAVCLGGYFSVFSAFSVGWKDINVGYWIQRLQRNEHTLGANGWVRTVSGIQSLISMYLLAIWMLTYFGRPFEY